ncbi:MAG: flagellar protein FlaG [Porticoccaceae bacterium]
MNDASVVRPMVHAWESRPAAEARTDPAVAAPAARPAVAAAGKESPGTPAQMDADGIVRAVTRLNERVQAVQRELQFSVDAATGYQVVKVLDARSGEVIRQMPSDQLLALAEILVAEGELPRRGLLVLGLA